MHEEEGLLELDWRPLMKSVDEDLLKGVSRGCIARKFHESLVNLVFDVAERFCLDRLVLGGGCFQNSFLLEGLAGMAQSRRCQLALPQRVPCNDGEFPGAGCGGRTPMERIGYVFGVPGKIVSVNETDPLFRLGVVDFGGVTREVNLACVPEAVPGDYVIVHVGMALSVLDEETALQTRREMREIVEKTDPL
ncbi:HypC/HybG/HupF family hydrogenase formation chaperone [Akkermansia muciniphila]|nr:HypC/HybG/HupF family hydrogenase formation chaperone [Akkermansia muciniphila]